MLGASKSKGCILVVQLHAAVSAEVVATGEGFSADEIVGTNCAPGLWLFGFDCLSSPLEWGRGRGPCRSSICPKVITAAVWPPGAEVVVAAAVVGGEPLGVCRPAGSPMWRLFVPAGVEPEFRLQRHLECRCLFIVVVGA
jgi:hypothetical protein